MYLDFEELCSELKETDVFKRVQPASIAKILPTIQEIEIRKGSYIFRAGDQADNLYFIREGSVHLIGKDKIISLSTQSKNGNSQLKGRLVYDTVDHGFVGEEVCFDSQGYQSDAVASEKCLLLMIPRKSLRELLKKNPQAKMELERSLVSHYHQDGSYAPVKTPKTEKEKIDEATASKKKKEVPFYKTLGWLLTLFVPLGIFMWGGGSELTEKQLYFTMILSATILMWIFQLTVEFVPSIFAVLAILVLDMVPASTALSGFTSGSFFLAMSVFAVGALLVTSGLAYRVVLYVLRFVPQSQFWYSLTLFLTGFIITPIFPTTNGRITLASPILVDMIRALGFKENGLAATRLSVATFAGFAVFATAFLSSKSINFVIYGLLPFQIREQFDWLNWISAAGVSTIVLMLFTFLFIALAFRNKEQSQISSFQVRAQIRVLGPLTKSEWSSILSIALFFIGITTSSIHKIQIAWIGLIVLYLALSLNFLTKREFQRNIDWSFLFYLGTLIGLVKSMSYLGIDKIIIQAFETAPLNIVAFYMTEDFYMFVIVLALLNFLVRFLIPNNACVIIFASVFLPIAEINGINVWVVGFIILMMSDGWFLPHQSTYYILFRELLKKEKVYQEKWLIAFSFWINIGRVLAILVSIPYWRSTGIL